MKIMGGWVTWLGVTGMVLLGIYDFLNADVDAGITKITGAVGLLGLGRKIEKSK